MCHYLPWSQARMMAQLIMRERILMLPLPLSGYVKNDFEPK